jgi:hypothetical protein
MKRRAFLGALSAGLLTAPLAAGPEPGGKISRVGVLFGSPASSCIEALRQGIKDVGRVEGSTILME